MGVVEEVARVDALDLRVLRAPQRDAKRRRRRDLLRALEAPQRPPDLLQQLGGPGHTCAGHPQQSARRVPDEDLRIALDDRDLQAPELYVRLVEGVPLDLHGDLRRPLGAGHELEATADLVDRKAADPLLPDRQSPQRARSSGDLGLLLVVDPRAEPLARDVVERHAAAVVSHDDRGTGLVGELQELDLDQGRIGVVGVLDEFDQADGLIADHLRPEDRHEARPGTKRKAVLDRIHRSA